MGAGPRVFVGAFGDPGHAFPALALGSALRRRGCEVLIETAEPWRAHAADVGCRFSPAPEFPVFPTKGRHLKPYEAVREAIDVTRPAVAEFAPDVVVADILTLAPALSAELEGIRWATLIPHLNPVTGSGVPPFGLGARLPRTSIGRTAWGLLGRPVVRGLEQGSSEYDELRRRVGLPPRRRIHSALSESLVILGTFPQLERGRAMPDAFKAVGPLFWEPPFGEVELPEGSGPLVLIAPSTAQDPDHRLLAAALEGLGDLPIRVIATWNRRPMDREVPVPPNTRLVEWLSYSRTIPHCSAVVSHGGHGTVARTLQAGAVPVITPWSGDQFENAARICELELGVRLPSRLLNPTTLSLAVERSLSEDSMARNCAGIASWAAEHDGADAAAALVVELAAT